MLHDHSDELRISWWEVAAAVPLRHTNSPELFAGRLNHLASKMKSRAKIWNSAAPLSAGMSCRWSVVPKTPSTAPRTRQTPENKSNTVREIDTEVKHIRLISIVVVLMVLFSFNYYAFGVTHHQSPLNTWLKFFEVIYIDTETLHVFWGTFGPPDCRFYFSCIKSLGSLCYK